jgi:rare lipoprotein A (peptidoglycan hydrolase)
MANLILLLSLLAHGHVGTGTVFGSSHRDRHNPNSRLACSHEELDESASVVAHNTLPCRSQVLLFNPRTGRSTVATVMDRGPRHALIDMSPAVAAALSLNGKEPVLVVPLPLGSPARVVDDRHHRRHPHHKVRKKERVA